MSPVSVSSVSRYLRDPRIELPDLGQLARAGEVPGVHEHVAVWDGVLDVGGQGVGVRHADETQLKILFRLIEVFFRSIKIFFRLNKIFLNIYISVVVTLFSSGGDDGARGTCSLITLAVLFQIFQNSVGLSLMS